MNNDERLKLKDMMNQMDYEDNTHNIRKLKHSVKIRDDIRLLENIKNTTDLETCKSKASFLFTNYTDIFHKVMKDELDLGIMTKILSILKLIEDEKVDQQEGSVMVGKLLKELYVDSAMRRSDNLDKEYPTEEKASSKPISWKEFKHLNA